MTPPANDNEETYQRFNETYIKKFGKKDRVKLFLRSLICQVQRVSYYSEDDAVFMQGWYDPKRDVTYITWMRPIQ